MISINILQNYNNRILNFSYKDFEKIIKNNDSKYGIKHKGVKLFVIENFDTGKVIPLPCVTKVFSNDPNKKLKFANNNSKCYMTSKALNIECKFNDCLYCYKQCLEHLNDKSLYLIKK